MHTGASGGVVGSTGSTRARPRRGRPGLVSVVLPVRDGAATLPQQLAALAGQTYGGDWELVVVDNGSRDRTATLLDGWDDRLPLRRVDTSRRPGISIARNAGMRAASGDLLVFCDADDVVEPGWLDAMVRAAATGELVGGQLDPVPLNAPTLRAARPAPQPADGLARAHGHLPYATGASLAIWAPVARSLGGFDEGFRTCGDDVDLSWRAQAAGHRLVHAPDAVTHYRYRTSWAATMLQALRYGIADTHLFHRHRAHLARRRPVRRAGFLRDPAALLRGRATRRAWCWRAAFWLGQHLGAVLPRPPRAPAPRHVHDHPLVGP